MELTSALLGDITYSPYTHTQTHPHTHVHARTATQTVDFISTSIHFSNCIQAFSITLTITSLSLTLHLIKTLFTLYL